MKVSFQLTMPNVGSWNGRWSGAGRGYFRVRSYTGEGKKRILALLGEETSKSFYYNFGDGWGANVKMEIVDGREGNKRMKETAGFCGYEWMIDSILKLGRISSDHENESAEYITPSGTITKSA